MIGVQLSTAETPITESTPSADPRSPPVMTDSATNCPAIWRRVAPSARRRPISPTRSSTESVVTFAMPSPPPRSAITPRMRNTTLTSACTLRLSSEPV